MGTQLNQAQKGATSTKREQEGGGTDLFENAENTYCYLNVSIHTAEKHLNKKGTVILVILFACAILKII